MWLAFDTSKQNAKICIGEFWVGKANKYQAYGQKIATNTDCAYANKVCHLSFNAPIQS